MDKAPTEREFITEQELDEIPSLCDECGKVHGTEACQYDNDEEFDNG